MSILFISGSPSAESRSARLLNVVRERVEQRGIATQYLSVRELPAEALLHANFNDPVLLDAVAQVAAANAIVLSSPVYKAAYSGVLKAFLDLLPQTGFANRVILPLATGGSPAHTLALDYSLRPVLAALGARDVIPGVFAIDSQLQWNAETAHLQIDPAIDERLDAAVRTLVEHLQRAEREALLQRDARAVPVPFSAVRYSA
ncbi:NADPH-dependent FMN reductase [Viridibacterium curvum]|uniref:NADPH-dependent FMN reductase n=1 Tax=Viridibacterium curvum TaxID=1101404 RepID=A0ABP9QN36_9RHOO